MITKMILRGSSHYASQVKRSLSKLLSRGERKNPFKYIMNLLLLDFEYFIQKKFHLSAIVLVPFLVGPNSCQEAKFFMPKVPKSIAMNTLEAFHLWSLATNVKA